MLNVIIVGAGGFGREVRQWASILLRGRNYHFKGYIDDNPDAEASAESDIRVLGTIHPGKKQYKICEHDRFLYAIGNIDNKREIISGLQNRGARFISLIHPSAIVAKSATIGEGVIICPFALISDRAVISDFCMINFYASCAHDSQVGKYSILSPYATLNGYVELEEEVFLGTHASVTAGHKIGQRTKIAANSAVMAQVPPNSLVIGVPGKHKRIYF